MHCYLIIETILYISSHSGRVIVYMVQMVGSIIDSMIEKQGEKGQGGEGGEEEEGDDEEEGKEGEEGE